MTYARTETDMHEALYKLACDYPTIPGTTVSGIRAVAQILGMSANTLRNKLSPDIDTHKTSFEEACAIMEVCAQAGMENAYSPLMALNWRLGFVAIPKEDDIFTDDECIHLAGSEVISHVGQAFGAANSALADSHIDHKELQHIDGLFRRATVKFHVWFERIKQRAKRDASKPRRPFFKKNNLHDIDTPAQ